MTDLLYIGASGARAYRAALAGVANNIANADNPDYVRRTVLTREATSIGHTSPLYFQRTAMHGAEIGGTNRSADIFADQGLRFALNQSGGAATRAHWLGLAETALGDGPQGVGTRLSAFFSSAEALAAAPADPALRATMLAALDDSARAFNATAGRLTELADEIGAAATTATASVNATLGELADVNRALRSAVPGSPGEAQLLDRRDAGLLSLSEMMPATIGFAEQGQAHVSLAGVTLLDGVTAQSLTVTSAADGHLSYASDGTPLPAFAQGVLGGIASAANALATQRYALDAQASQFAIALNGWQAGGQMSDGTPGIPLLSGITAATLALTTTDSSAIAAATPGSANGNLLAMSTLRGPSGAEASWQALVTAGATQLQSARGEADAANAQTDYALERRDSVSGVDLDREAADLLRLQQSYDAAARVIQVARDTMQSILSIF